MDVNISRSPVVDVTFSAPPSKSYTHRALIAASLAAGRSRICRPLDAEDTRLTARALRSLGVPVDWGDNEIVIDGTGGALPGGDPVTLDLGNSGTSLRLLSSIALVSPRPVVLTGNRRMLERPLGPLVEALRALGGEVAYLGRSGYPPIRVEGRFSGGTAAVDASMSSQFISSILMAGPSADGDVELKVPEMPASRSYLDVTVDVMEAFGATVGRDGYTRFRVRRGTRYTGREYTVEGDYSSASYFFAVAAICGGTVRVNCLSPASVQGDRRFLDALEAMGCLVAASGDTVTVTREDELFGITIDMSSAPDTVQTLAVVAATAATPTTITGVGHLQYKESDRVRVTAENLQRMGAGVSVGADRITITPAPLHGVTVNPVDDHRTAMSFAVLGLGVGGMTIRDAECVGKSFPGFWDALRGAGLL
ncbi:3-phosphoshikimate 1-carboxyvinyltransferase [Methanoculleus taiwanensis]|uniref:3-phosphoshikimate 1-carboxyvinyltransferase n=1 Tax=Methanoculleus taiwanensis TaxID=1550565 RepID=A0A498GYK1_9EURY|nr:3-phosphoshikimate 1-carboxyvinyltransferase [Methanoculleus taiwanensis]RXE55247.1 3-phosphoshikimate 1-carboxyvinyltransferase [Methanoculleus taiwanensis]